MTPIMTPPTEQEAHDMGANGSPHSEQERVLFEAYMRGHCWHVGEWSTELGCYGDVQTRMLFGVWRDRGALSRRAAVPATRAEIAVRLREQADEMDNLAAAMDYYGGFAKWAQHGREIAGAGAVARQWAVEIETAGVGGLTDAGGEPGCSEVPGKSVPAMLPQHEDPVENGRNRPFALISGYRTESANKKLSKEGSARSSHYRYSRVSEDAEIARLRDSAAFYKRRCDALQKWQSSMRDPERTVVCDILANGETLPPSHAGDRYGAMMPDTDVMD